MKLRLVIALAVLLVAPTPPPARAQVNTCSSGERAHVSVPDRYPYGRYTRALSLASKADGAAIEIGLVRPEVPPGVRVPVIVRASPYFPPLHTVNLETCDAFLVENFVPQGYAVALVAVRGTADSGGCFDLFGPLERADLDQAVRWLGTQPWSNGRVGMLGLSYDGSTPWMVAAAGNPYLKTIVPMDGVPDLFDLLFGAGTPDFRGPGLLSALYYGTSVISVQGRAPERSIEATACPDYAVGQAASAYSSITGDLDPFGYWEPRRYVDDILRRYRGSIFLIQGLQDWNVNPAAQFPLITDLRARGRPVKMLLGQWAHTYADLPRPPAGRADFADILLRWFDRSLKGSRRPAEATVDVQDSEGRWRHEASWPPDGRRVLFRPTPSGELTTHTAPAGTMTIAPDPAHFSNPLEAQGAFSADLPVLHVEPGELCEQPLCAVFKTVQMHNEFRFAGSPRLRLSVTPLGSGGTISAFLYAETDRFRRLGWGQVDLRFPRGARAPHVVTPGRPMDVDLELQPLDAVVRPGEQLVLVVGMGNTYNRVPLSPPGPVVLELGERSDGLSLTEARGTEFFRPRRR